MSKFRIHPGDECDCGRPAELIRSGCRICRRCNDLEFRTDIHNGRTSDRASLHTVRFHREPATVALAGWSPDQL